jgi:hypothetical protein
MTPDELRDYWDALVSGAPAAETGLDAELAATIRDVHALDDAPAPDPSLMSAVWRELVGEPLTTTPLETLRIETPAVNGRRNDETDRLDVTVARFAAPRRRRLDPVLRVDRLLAIGVIAGFGAGFVGGIGVRLAMRVAGMLTIPANQGLLTDNGNVVGQITLDGTLFLAFFAGAIGVLGGLLYVAVRSRLPGTGVRRGLVYGGLLLATFGFIVMDKNNPDYRLFGPPGVNVGTFSSVYILFGLVVAPLADWLDRRIPIWPRVRPLGFRGIAGYVVLAPLGVIGFVVIVVGAIGAGGMTGLLFGGLIAVSTLSPIVRRRVRSTRLPRPALAGRLLLAAPSLIGLVLTVRAIVGILGAG